MLNKEKLKEIATRCEAATPGPWESFVEGCDHDSGSSIIWTPTVDLELLWGTAADFDFIAAARQDIPLLLEEVERLQEIIRACPLCRVKVSQEDNV